VEGCVLVTNELATCMNKEPESCYQVSRNIKLNSPFLETGQLRGQAL